VKVSPNSTPPIKKIKVLQFICSTAFYGAERWILALAKHLPSEFIECDLVVTDETENQDLELVNQYKKQCSFIGKVHHIPMQGRFDLRAIKRLASLIKSENVDVIHTHGYKSDIIGVLAARKAGIKSIVTPHGFENAEDIKLRTFIWLGGKMMRLGTVVAPLSKQLVKDSINYGVPESKIHYIQNGVDLSEVNEARLDPKVRADKVPKIKRVGFIGQMISRKNIRDILDIFEKLHAENLPIELVFLGDGDERDQLENYAQTLSSKNSIQFLGFRDDRLALLKSFDLFVMTSTLEGIPRCLMEAQAMGIPVAAYNIPGIDQLIKHGENGLLAPLHDKDLLKSYWKTLLSDEGYGLELAKNGMSFVEEHYSASRMATEYTELFMELLANER
jgi:glycosyltransferase involved in cell wall biosynthesis